VNPFNGTWTANLSKSQRHPNHQFQSAKLCFEVSHDTVLLMHEGVNMAGQHESGKTVLHPDGKEHESPQAPGVIVITEWVGTHRIDSKAWKEGRNVGHGAYEVSLDGAALTATVSGIDVNGYSRIRWMNADLIREYP
jgi:hypothetical protein